MGPLDLIAVAHASMALPGKGRPSQACLRRATSTAYYALFHCLAREGADLFIGGDGANRRSGAWVQTYRALDHGHIRSQCENKAVVGTFPQGIVDLTGAFVTLQSKRHRADYDPLGRYAKSIVRSDIDLARTAIGGFKAENIADRRAFCAWVLFRTPRK